MRRRIVWATIAGALTTFFLMFVRYNQPHTKHKPTNQKQNKPPADYAIGVDTIWQQQYRIWVSRSTNQHKNNNKNKAW